MKITRRNAIRLAAAGVTAPEFVRAQSVPDIAAGPFQGARESLRSYRAPEWFRDSKFGIWAHWGPQSAPEYGDWYARNMYIQGHKQYKYHLQKYGHPSKFGFKDVIPTWKAERFDPDEFGTWRGVGDLALSRPDELAECDRHESPLNLAFAEAPDFHLLCPYDVGTLAEPELLQAKARRKNQVVFYAPPPAPGRD